MKVVPPQKKPTEDTVDDLLGEAPPTTNTVATIPPRRLYVGLIVHFYRGQKEEAAIVRAVWPNEELDLTVFTREAYYDTKWKVPRRSHLQPDLRWDYIPL